MKQKLTKALKDHLVTLGMDAGLDDAEVRKFMSKQLVGGKLEMDKVLDLLQVEDPTDPAKAWEQMVDKKLEEKLAQRGGNLGVLTNGPAYLYAKAAEFAVSDPARVRVKGAAETYSKSTTRAVYPERTHLGSKHLLAGQPAVKDASQTPLDHPSQYTKAITGAWMKYLVQRGAREGGLPVPPGWKLTDHDKDLILHAAHECKWTGFAPGTPVEMDLAPDDARVVNNRKLTDFEIKALLDDSGPSGSGGIEITPIEFDDAVVTFPVLYGELYPLVNVVPVTRGRRIKGGSIANPTFTWGTAEGTAIGLFNTAGFITAFDTTIYPCVGAMVLGLDFLEDSPTNVGELVVKNYGLKFMEQLDFVLAVGDGVTQPTGVFTNAGTTAVLADNGSNGPPTVGDYEALFFSVPKQFRTEAGARGVYIANDTSYQRARGIPVGPFDQRRVFGMDEGEYQLFKRDYKIQNSGIPNNKQAYVMMNRYRMYRRLGLTVRQETAGQTLSLANERLLVLRARFGGQLEQGAAAAIITNGQQ